MRCAWSYPSIKRDRDQHGFAQPREVFGPRDRVSAKTPRVSVDDLGVEQHKAALAQPIEEVYQRDLRGIIDSVEHRLAGEQPANRHAVDPADEFPAEPRLDAVSLPKLMQTIVSRDHVGRDPGPL